MENIRPAIVLTLWFALVTGLAFPVFIWGVGNLAFPTQAKGSLIRDEKGEVIGSALIGQRFSKPEYFHPRPSAAGAGYDAASSGGTNLGPISDKLINGIHDDPETKEIDESYAGFRDLAKAYREQNGLAADVEIPADAATRSASGLDPEISPRNAELQLARVAKARRMSPEEVRALIAQHTEGRTLGVFGEPRVHVLRLNLALDAQR